ncbi:hypothetical protein [Saccharothrix coeruleofusca]|uniref:hypothetical protein n=1 Tax=Saccharothrix coeruleofusca TaxID=33919 RepID=UPI001E484506|nr:hypothetical protein [Saccharothrix coeruleofusca]
MEPDFGMPVENARKFQQVAAQQDVVIDVRATNPHSVAWLRRGALPKPQPVKAKTITDLDVRLGARRGQRGLVGYFRPVLPGGRCGEHLLRRFTERRAEYDSLRDKMDALERGGQFVVRDGVVHGYDRAGALRPLTGDHDVFDIHSSAGVPLPERRYHRVVDAMIGMDMGVTHGAHMYWQPENMADLAVFEAIARDTGPKLRFHPDGVMTAGDYRRANAGTTAITAPASAVRPWDSASRSGSWSSAVEVSMSSRNRWP